MRTRPDEKWPVKTIIMVFTFSPNVNYKLLGIKYGLTLRHFIIIIIIIITITVTVTVTVTITITITSNGNRTDWSPIRSVIIRVITKSGDRAAGVDLFITSMITDQIERHEVLLPFNHKNYDFREKKNSQVMKERDFFLNYNFECDCLI